MAESVDHPLGGHVQGEPSRPFGEFLSSLGVLLGVLVFVCAAGASLAVGVDPIWALARSVAAFVAVVVVYEQIARVLRRRFDVDPREAAAPEQPRDESERTPHQESAEHLNG